MLDIRTRIRTDLNPSKRIWFRIRSENICTVFIPSEECQHEERSQAIYCQFADHAKKIFKAGKFLKKNRTKYKPVNYIQIWKDESRDERGFQPKYVP